MHNVLPNLTCTGRDCSFNPLNIMIEGSNTILNSILGRPNGGIDVSEPTLILLG